MPTRSLPLVLLCIPACLLMSAPFLALIAGTSWSDFQLSYGDWDAISTSLCLGAASLILVFLLGVPIALWLARTTSRVKPVAEALVLAAVLTPPLAMGILLIATYGPYGTVGQPLGKLGISLNNNIPAFILSQLYGGLSYFIMAARAAFEGVPAGDEEAAKTLGATRVQIFVLVTLPLAFRGLAAGVIIAWVRMIGEFGIVVVFAYFPHGVPVALFTNLQNEGVDAVYALLWLMLVATLPLPLLLLALLKRTGAASMAYSLQRL